jgi:hypothetical protein
LFIDFDYEGPYGTVATISHPLRPGFWRSANDDALVNLFAHVPSAAMWIMALYSGIDLSTVPNAVKWVLTHVMDLPLVAATMLSNHTDAVLRVVSPETIEAAILEINHSIENSQEPAHHLPYFRTSHVLRSLAPYHLSSDATLTLLRNQDHTNSPMTTAWLAGEFPHQLPTEDEIRALFENPQWAFGCTWLDGSNEVPSQEEAFAHSLASSSTQLRTILSQPWADTFVDLLKGFWPFVVTGSYLLTRIRASVGSSVPLQQVLQLLASSPISMSLSEALHTASTFA